MVFSFSSGISARGQRPSESVGVFVLNFGSTVSDPCVIPKAHESACCLAIHSYLLIFGSKCSQYSSIALALQEGDCKAFQKVTRGKLLPILA